MHTEKSFRNLVKSTRNQDVFTIFWSWFQKDFSMCVSFIMPVWYASDQYSSAKNERAYWYENIFQIIWHIPSHFYCKKVNNIIYLPPHEQFPTKVCLMIRTSLASLARYNSMLFTLRRFVWTVENFDWLHKIVDRYAHFFETLLSQNLQKFAAVTC